MGIIRWITDRLGSIFEQGNLTRGMSDPSSCICSGIHMRVFVLTTFTGLKSPVFQFFDGCFRKLEHLGITFFAVALVFNTIIIFSESGQLKSSCYELLL